MRLAKLAFIASMLAVSTVTPGQEWTRFRGPNGSGLANGDGIPSEWSEKDEAWRVEVPGLGNSAPVLWGDRLFLTSSSPDGTERMLLCLRARDGSTEWLRKLASKTFPKHQRNTYAGSTPTVDAERVYYVFSTPASYVISAADHSGKDVWQRDLGPYVSQHGDGASPILFEDMVVLPGDQDEKSDGFLIALDRKSGEVRWRTPRKPKVVAYGTPCVLEAGGAKPLLVFSSQAHGLSAVDPATGKAVWEADLFDKRTVSSPIVASGLVLGTCGSGAGGNYVAAVRPGGNGDVSTSHLAWKLTKSAPYVPTPVAKDDLLFLWSDAGIVTCVELPSGSQVWQQRVGGNYSGSPICLGDRVLCMSEEGDAVIVAASREFKLIAKNPLGDGTRCTPSVAGGRLFLRTYRHLIAVGKPAAKP